MRIKRDDVCSNYSGWHLVGTQQMPPHDLVGEDGRAETQGLLQWLLGSLGWKRLCGKTQMQAVPGFY